MERQKDFSRIDGVKAEPGRRHAIATPQKRPQAPLVNTQDADPLVTSRARKAAEIKPALPRTAKSMVLRRQMVERAKQQRQKNRKKYGKHVIAYAVGIALLIAMGLILWAFQGLLPFSIPFNSNDQSNQPVNRPIVQETSSLDETERSSEEIAAHKMGAEEPKTLRIPRLGINAKISRVGVALSGEPIAPGNIFDVGWFEASGKPGALGAVLLNGHVSGPGKDGIFRGLDSLNPQDEIIIERGDGQLITYRVDKVLEYSSTQLDMSAVTQSIDPDKSGLNLITTTNKFTSRGGFTDKRLIIFALQQ